MIHRAKKKNILVTIFVLVFLCIVGITTFIYIMKTEKKIAETKQLTLNQSEQKKVLSTKKAEYEITQTLGADKPNIYYENKKKIIFTAYFGLFVYSKDKEKIVQSLDLKEIDNSIAQQNNSFEINVSKDGKTVYLHIKNDKKMYLYSVNKKELQYLDYNLPKCLYNRKQWEKTNQSGIKCNGDTIGDLVYWYDNGDVILKYRPLFYKPYGTCRFFKPKDIRDLKEVSFYANGTEYIINDEKKLRWIEKRFSEPIEEIKGASACPFYHIMYFKRKDGRCGKVFPATDSCSDRKSVV